MVGHNSSPSKVVQIRKPIIVWLTELEVLSLLKDTKINCILQLIYFFFFQSSFYTPSHTFYTLHTHCAANKPCLSMCMSVCPWNQSRNHVLCPFKIPLFYNWIHDWFQGTHIFFCNSTVITWYRTSFADTTPYWVYCSVSTRKL